MEFLENYVIGAVKTNSAVLRFTPLKISYAFEKSVLGHVLAAKTEGGLCWISFVTCKQSGLEEMRRFFPKAVLSQKDKILPSAHSVADLDLYGTPFQISVWKALLKIQKGKTVSYSDIARKIGSPKAVRAVGTAVGSNPVSILVPCHRVLRHDGGIGGYAWGIALKRKILLSENITA